MKRRTRLSFVSCAALCGTFSFIGPALAGAQESVGRLDDAALRVEQASGSPPGVVHTPTGRVTVSLGNSLTTIGAQTARTFLDPVPITIPPRTYVPVVTAAPPAPPAPPPAPPVVTSYDHRWDRVAACEEGGWIGWAGPNYPDSLGINAANWYANGGGSDESPAAEVAVAQRIEGTSYVPDQGYCASW